MEAADLYSLYRMVTLKIRSRSLNLIILTPFQKYIYANLVKIHQLVQKITHRNEATRIRTPTPAGSAPKTKMLPPPYDKGDITNKQNYNYEYNKQIC